MLFVDVLNKLKAQSCQIILNQSQAKPWRVRSRRPWAHWHSLIDLAVAPADFLSLSVYFLVPQEENHYLGQIINDVLSGESFHFFLLLWINYKTLRRQFFLEGQQGCPKNEHVYQQKCCKTQIHTFLGKKGDLWASPSYQCVGLGGSWGVKLRTKWVVNTFDFHGDSKLAV